MMLYEAVGLFDQITLALLFFLGSSFVFLVLFVYSKFRFHFLGEVLAKLIN